MLNTSKSAKFFRIALWAAMLAFVAVVFNAYARLSEAGLGCPDWPGCYGKLFAPLTAQDLEQTRLPEEQKQLEKKRAGQETAQRFIAGGLALVLMRLSGLGWQLKRRKRNQQTLIPLATLLLVFGMGIVGLATFEHRYKPLVMMMQLIGGMTVLGLLWWIVMREQRFWKSVSVTPVSRRLRPRALFGIGLVSFQIVLGGWSMMNYAGLACPDFPACQGTWWPPMDFHEAFTRWRDVGLDYEGRLLALPAATAIHMAHRVGALIVLLYIGWLSLHVVRVGNNQNLCRYGLLVLVALLAQTALGIMEVVAHLPLALAVLHNAAAALLLMALITFYHVVRAPRTL
jgi:cytochrome c oxidase assembly protein subunit 15